jgi:hypothetical protein
MPAEAGTGGQVAPSTYRWVNMTPASSQVIPAAACRTYESLFDSVTRLPGWPILIDRTAMALARCERRGSQVLVLVLEDVRSDRGVPIHVRVAAAALQACVRTEDTIARVDERTIVVVCNEIGADSDGAQIARRLLTRAGLECRMGIALSGGHDDPKSLLTTAVRDVREQRAGV